MFILSLILLQVIIFAGLLIFLRRMLTRNVTHATAHLQGLTQEYDARLEEIKKRETEANALYEEAKRRAQKELDIYKDQFKKEIEEQREKIITQAHTQSEELVQRAQKTCEQMRADMEQLIADQAREEAAAVMKRVLPESARRYLHALWFDALMRDGLATFERLRIPEGLTQATVSTAFSLVPEQFVRVQEMLRKRLEHEIVVSEAVQPDLIAGVVITVGNVVIDGSFLYTIREVGRAGDAA
ncbi:MAG: F0F1 ATP synthase subunit delta [Candidatus Omnitrophica bacterium]|nr:F0F1 ATP synthase subunit delta [Candidatus Omnitrophota bacterium]